MIKYLLISVYQFEKNGIDSIKNKNIKKSRKNEIIEISLKSKVWNLFKSKNFIKIQNINLIVELNFLIYNNR